MGNEESLVANSNSNFSTTSKNLETRSLTQEYTLDSTKKIFIKFNHKYFTTIALPSNEESNLTCGWLISECIRKYNKFTASKTNYRPIISLQSYSKNISIDHWISNFENPISCIPDRTLLCPIFVDNNYSNESIEIGISDFELLRLIGTGGFSKNSRELYAIKVIGKKEMMQKNKLELVLRENEIMQKINHPFLTKLHYAFQDEKNLFFVMDLYSGGELFYHLNQKRKFSERDAKIYIGQIILALNYLHENKIVYRDLKPENILLDFDGYVHLIDFGLSYIFDSNEKETTICGSSEYMAPEMILNNGYDYMIDYYCIGILAYELVTGSPPFFGPCTKIFHKILNESTPMPDGATENLKSFLVKILEKDPKKRLGAKGGFSEVLNHPWFDDLDLINLIKRKLKNPIIPDLSNNNFEDEKQIQNEYEKIFSSNQDMEFHSKKISKFNFNRSIDAVDEIYLDTIYTERYLKSQERKVNSNFQSIQTEPDVRNHNENFESFEIANTNHNESCFNTLGDPVFKLKKKNPGNVTFSTAKKDHTLTQKYLNHNSMALKLSKINDKLNLTKKHDFSNLKNKKLFGEKKIHASSKLKKINSKNENLDTSFNFNVPDELTSRSKEKGCLVHTSENDVQGSYQLKF